MKFAQCFRLLAVGFCFLSAWSGLAGSSADVKDLLEELKAQGPVAIMRDDFPFSGSEEGSGVPRATRHNKVKLHCDGVEAFADRFHLLEHARESILIQTYIFTDDVIGWRTAELLKQRWREGLDVRLVVDAYTKFVFSTRMMYRNLEYNGVRVAGYEPVIFMGWTEQEMISVPEVNMRYHEKYMIVDDEFAITGGMNIADEYARFGDDPENQWRDQDVLLSGPVVADIREAFESNYQYFMERRAQREELLKPIWYRKWWPRVLEFFRPRWLTETGSEKPGPKIEGWEDEDAEVRFLRSRPRHGETFIFQAYRFLIESAKERIVIENSYFVPQQRILRDLIQAVQRGVDVTIITNCEETNDVYQMQPITRHSYLPLIEAGVKIYEWQGLVPLHGSLHSKFAVFDDEISVIGSYNIDPRAESLNSEDVVIIRSSKVISALLDYINNYDLPVCRRIDLEQAKLWRNPPDLTGRFKLLFGKALEDWY